MIITINKVRFKFFGDELFTHISEQLINDDQLEYNKLIKKLSCSEKNAFAEFLVKDKFVVNERQKIMILVSLINS